MSDMNSDEVIADLTWPSRRSHRRDFDLRSACARESFSDAFEGERCCHLANREERRKDAVLLWLLEHSCSV